MRKDLPIHDEMPVLTFRDLTPTELVVLREPDEECEIGDSIVPVSRADTYSAGAESDESDEIFEEGEEHVEPEMPRSASVGPHGGRLVRGQLP
jgi:hypothetical protein